MTRPTQAQMAKALYESHRTEYNGWPKWGDISLDQRRVWLLFGDACMNAMRAMYSPFNAPPTSTLAQADQIIVGKIIKGRKRKTIRARGT